MLKYSLLEIGNPERSNIFQSHLQQLLKLIQSTGVEFPFWSTIALGSRLNSDIVKEVSVIAAYQTKIKSEEGGYYEDGMYKHSTQSWHIRTTTDAAAAALMLPYAQPLILNIFFLPSKSILPETLSDLLQTVTKHHTGKLELFLDDAYMSYSACDILMNKLANTR